MCFIILEKFNFLSKDNIFNPHEILYNEWLTGKIYVPQWDKIFPALQSQKSQGFVGFHRSWHTNFW